MNQILVVEDEPVIRSALRKLLERYEYQVTEADSVETARKLPLNDMALIISDLRLPAAPGTDLIDLAAPTPVLIMTSYASLRSAVDAMKQGAVDYIAKPFNHDEMVLAVERILKEQQQSRRTRALSADVELSYPVADIIGESDVMQALLHQIDKLAPSDTSILLNGESGTGKELVARAIHQKSQRAQAPLITFNCTAVGGDQQEAELFGCEVGAFGDNGSRRGLAEEAHDGTLFIDEVGDLTATAQARLLQLIDKGEVLRLGGLESRPVSVRLVASSQSDLADKTRRGEFREDLYYRIKGAELDLPPLREREQDILPLANSLLSRTAERLNSGEHHFSQDAIAAMTRYRWPGNVRELGNAIERAVILAEGSAITPELLGITSREIQQQTFDDASQEELSLKEYFTRFVLENQDEMTETELARKLGISRKCLWERRQRFNLPRKKA